MLVWCATLFVLGILAFFDSVFNMGEIFRRVNSVLFLLISLALLIRTTTKAKEQRLEKYQSRLFSLEREVRSMKAAQEQLDDY